MGILIIAVGGLALGFGLILLLSASAPKVEEGPHGTEDSPHAWLARLDAPDMGKLLGQLFAELKFEVEDARVTGSVVDLFATNPTPITGGRVYIRGVCHPPLGVVGEDEVRVAMGERKSGPPAPHPGGGPAPSASSSQISFRRRNHGLKGGS